MAADLTAVIRNLSKAERTLIAVETDISGLEISVNDLKNQMQRVNKSSKTSDEEKRAAQENYAAETEKLKEELRKQEALETEIFTLRKQKIDLLKAIKTEEDEARVAGGPTYEVLSPRDSNSNMQGSVISQIPEYNGAFGAEAESFVKLIDRTKDQYNWLSKPTAYMVRTKLTGAARTFVDNQEKEMLTGIDEWDGDVLEGKNLKQMLLDKFAMPITAAAATTAVEELKQENQESVDSFYERTRFAVDKLLFNVARTTAEEKKTYQTLFQTQVYIFFKAGLLSTYRTKIFSAPQNLIPVTAVALLEAARNAEREINIGKKNISPKAIFSADNVNPEIAETSVSKAADSGSNSTISGPTRDSTLEVETLKLQVAELQKQFRGRGRGRGNRGRGGRGFNRGRGGNQMRRGYPGGARGRGIGRGRGRPDLGCFNCGQMGHWADACPEPRAPESIRKQIEERKLWSMAIEEEENEDLN